MLVWGELKSEVEIRMAILRTTASVSRRQFLKTTGAAASAVAISGIGFPAIAQSKPEQLIIADPAGTTGDAYVKAHYSTFTEKTGIRVVQAQYVGIAQLKAMVENKAWGTCDLTLVSTGEAALASRQGLAEKIDYDLFDRSTMIPQSVREQYCLTDVAAGLLAWNTSRYDRTTAPQNWRDFFTPGKFKGPRGLWKNASQTMDIAALGSGIAMDKLYPLDVKAAIGALQGVKDELVFWEHGAESVQFLIDNQVDFEFAWNGRVDGPKKDGQPVDYTFADAVCDGDTVVIPKGSPNQYWAQRLVAHMMQAENQAALAQLIPYGPTNTKANALIPAEIQAILPTGPANFSKVTFQDFDWWAEHGQEAYDAFNSFLLG
jgi:putative spermidine/putrescine transport system substrate-binding protein